VLTSIRMAHARKEEGGDRRKEIPSKEKPHTIEIPLSELRGRKGERIVDCKSTGKQYRDGAGKEKEAKLTWWTSRLSGERGG